MTIDGSRTSLRRRSAFSEVLRAASVALRVCSSQGDAQNHHGASDGGGGTSGSGTQDAVEVARDYLRYSNIRNG
jgi:hypothetical protein